MRHNLYRAPIDRDPYWPNVVIAMHMNTPSPFYDEKQHTITTGGNVTGSATQSKFGPSSLYFDGSGDYVQVLPSSSCNFGNTFTIELWSYTTQSQPTVNNTWDAGPLFSQSNNGYAGEQFLGIFSSNNSVAFIQHGSPAQNSKSIGWTILAMNQWNHIAVCCNAGTLKLFVNGVSQGTPLTEFSWSQRNMPMYLGYNSVPAYSVNDYYIGYIDDFRITAGVARYINDFTPPVFSFPNV